MKRFALVVWIGKYRDKRITPLHFAEGDGHRSEQGFRELLGFDEVTVIPGDQADASRVLDALEEFKPRLSSGDLLVIYFAGHGLELGSERRPVLACVGANNGLARHGTGDLLPVEALRDAFDECEGLQVVIILDACRAPWAEGARSQVDSDRDLSRGFGLRSRNLLGPRHRPTHDSESGSLCSFTFVFSCSKQALAYESKGLEGGVFTVAFWNVVQACVARGERVELGAKFIKERVSKEMKRLARQVGLAGQRPSCSSDASTPPLLFEGSSAPSRPPIESEPVNPTTLAAKRWKALALVVVGGVVIVAAVFAVVLPGFRPVATSASPASSGVETSKMAASRPLTAVEGIRVRPGTNGSLRVDWSTNVPGYQVWRGPTADFARATQLTSRPISGPSYLDTKPLPAQSFYWVQGVREQEEGPMGDPVEGWTLGAPTQVVAQRSLDGAVELSWGPSPAAMPKESRYEVWARMEGEPSDRRVAVVGREVHRFTDDDARTRAVHALTIGVRTASASWGSSPMVSVQVAPVHPPTVDRLGGSTNGAIVYWPTNVQRALRFELVSREGDGPTNVLRSWSVEEQSNKRDGESIPLPLVSPAPTDYRIEAVNAGGRTPATEWVRVEPTRESPLRLGLDLPFVPVPGIPVLFSIYEVRVKDFEEFALANLHDGAGLSVWSPALTNWVIDTSKSWINPGFPQGPEHPVCGVSYEDAVKFAQWFTERERKAGRLGSNDVCRLPRELEWIAAVGIPVEAASTPQEGDGKIGGVYLWGSQWPPPKGAGNFADQAFKAKYPEVSAIDGYDDGSPETSQVGSFAANRYGLHDLAGNLWEFCEDYYNAKDGSRVLRGGSWRTDDPRFLLSWYRFYDRPGNRYNFIGFRLVVERGVAAPQ